MGNSAGKNRTAHENLASHAADLTEREAASAWYRHGVAVTDVYDVVEVLGRGHMGEVFTVRRKTTGHHNDFTRERSRMSDGDLKSTHDSGEEARERAAYSKKPSSESNGSDASPGSVRRRKSFKGAVHKTKKVIAKQAGKAGGDKGGQKLDEDANSDLTPFISSDDIVVGVHEPPKTPSKPAKSIMKDKNSMHWQSKDSRSTLTRTDTNSNSDVVSLDSESSHTSTSIPAPPFARTLTSESSKIIEKPNKGVHFQRTFAVKTIATSRINTADVQELANEIMIMRKLDHPYVLKLYEVYHVKRKLWLVTELCSGGDLSARKLNEQDAKNVIEQILRALVYLHRMGIVHRDIKLENVLYENSAKGATVRLIDFGLSRTYDRAALATDYTRTPYTMSPETASSFSSSKDGRVGGEDITDKTDVWALGVVTFIVLSGEFPFIKTSADLKDKNLIDKLKRADFDFGCTWNGRRITTQARQFVKGCLQASATSRWTSKQALEFVHKVWGPEVDKIWDDWQAQRKQPEFVKSPDLPEDDESDSKSEASNASWIEENDIDVDPSPAECEARAKHIVKHVHKVVKAKKAENHTTDKEDDVKINVDDIERYTKHGLMKKFLLITMANTMDRSDVGKLREIFLQADTNNSGTLTLQEFICSVREISPEVDEARTKDLFSGIDRDKSGHIHYAEFLAALAESHGLVTLDRLSEAFDRIDKDGKGYITHEDLKYILGKDYDKETVDKMIKEGDFKKNNKIDYEELLQMMFSDPVKGAEIVGSSSRGLTVDDSNVPVEIVANPPSTPKTDAAPCC